MTMLRDIFNQDISCSKLSSWHEIVTLYKKHDNPNASVAYMVCPGEGAASGHIQDGIPTRVRNMKAEHSEELHSTHPLFVLDATRIEHTPRDQGARSEVSCRGSSHASRHVTTDCDIQPNMYTYACKYTCACINIFKVMSLFAQVQMPHAPNKVQCTNK